MATELSKEQLRTFIVLFSVSILIGIVLLAKYFFEGIVYSFFLIFALAILVFFDKIVKFAGVRGDTSKLLFGVSNKWLRGIGLGVLFGVGFLFLSQFKLVGMAVPTIPLSVSGQGLVVVAIAPVCEEIFFSMAILSVLALFMPFWLGALIKGFTFSAYHYFAYASNTNSSIESVFGAFLSAGIFGFISSYLAKYGGVESSITGHMIFNGYNFNNIYHILSVAG